MQELLLKILQAKDFTPESYRHVQTRIHEIMIAPYDLKFSEVAREAAAISEEVYRMLGRQKDDVVTMAESVDAGLDRGVEPAVILANVRDVLKDVIQKMTRDADVLAQLSHRDSLTGLANRRSFDAFLSETVQCWLADETPAALIIFDIDHFKSFNDTYGHLVGDQVLRTLATKVQQIVDSLPGAPSGVLAARFGGEEFVLVLRGPVALEAVDIGERVRRVVQEATLLLRDANDNVIESGLHVTVSVGVASLWSGWTGAYEINLLDCADKALYHAKNHGRNCTVEYTPDGKQMYTKILRREPLVSK